MTFEAKLINLKYVKYVVTNTFYLIKVFIKSFIFELVSKVLNVRYGRIYGPTELRTDTVNYRYSSAG